MPRLFVAIELPEIQRKLLSEILRGLSDARWVHTERIHLTLRFIGNKTEDELASIKAALNQVEFAPIEAKLSGVGTFPKDGAPVRVLWAGIQPEEALRALHQKIETALVKAGCQPQSAQEFQPHITLSRFKKPPHRDLERWLVRNSTLTSPTWPIDSFTLYASELTPEQAIHKPLLTRQATSPT